MARKTTKSDPRRKLVEAALDLAASAGWRNVGMADVAAHAGVPLGDAVTEFPTKWHVTAAMTADADAAMTAEADDLEADETTRDKLFALVMARLDTMAGRREAIGAMLRASFGDVSAAAVLVPRFGCSMVKLLELAGIDTSGPAGCLQTKVMGALYMDVVRVWLRDDTPDMSHTMAALDKRLRRVDQVAASVFGRRGRGDTGDGPDDGEAGPASAPA